MRNYFSKKGKKAPEAPPQPEEKVTAPIKIEIVQPQPVPQPVSQPTPVAETVSSSFNLSHENGFFGRTTEVRAIKALFGKHDIVVVTGPGGIGKTEVCREVIARLKHQCYPVNLMNCGGYGQFLILTATALSIDSPQDKPSDLLQALIRSKLEEVSSPALLYYDNFEDVIGNQVSEEEQNSIKHSLRKYSTLKAVKVLLSSRTGLTAPGVSIYPLDTLDDESAIKLFTNIWGEEQDQALLREFVTSENDLAKYPLSIVLAASQRWPYPTLSELVRAWRTTRDLITNDLPGNDRHHSLKTSLLFTWKQIEDDEVCRKIWELFLLFPKELPKDEMGKILDLDNAQLTNALLKLRRMSVLRPEGEDCFSMLAPMKEILGFDGVRDEYVEVKMRLWVFYRPFKATKRDGSEDSLFIIKNINQLLFFMERLILDGDTEPFLALHNGFFNYYNASPVNALTVLQRVPLKELPEQAQASILEYMGDLEHQTDKLEAAEGHYGEAVVICRRIGYDPGLANVLMSLGDLEVRTDKLEAAEGHYGEAKEIFKRIKDDLGLANVLLSLGDLERLTDKPEAAEGHYGEAMEKYERIKDDLGLANVLKSLGNLAGAQGDYPGAYKQYQQALPLYDKVGDKLGYAYTLSDLCLTSAMLGKVQEFQQFAKEAHKLAEDLPYPDLKKTVDAAIALGKRGLGLPED